MILETRRLAWSHSPIFTLVVALAFAVSFSAGHGAEWKQYRGPNHDGSSTDAVQLDWGKHPPKQVWRVPLDPGLSSITASRGKAFTQVRRRSNGEDREFAIALDAKTGRELWATDLDLADYPDGGVGSDDGPRSTPTVDGDRVYVLTTYLRLYCLAIETGAVIWSRDFVSEFGSNLAPWQNAASPLLVGDLIFVNGNAPGARLAAVRKSDGQFAWRAHDEAMTQATPVFGNVAGRDQVIFFTQSGLIAVTPQTGNTLWRYAFNFSTSTAATPVVAGDLVYCSAAYGSGAAVVRVQPSGNVQAATQVWRTRGANQNHWATPIHDNGFLYGIYGQSVVSLRCVELATGVQKWSRSGVGRGGVIKLNDKLLTLTEEGDVVLAALDSANYIELGRYAAVRGKCWNTPAVSDGRLYARSTTEAVCLDISVAVPATPLSLLASVRADGSVEIVARSEDGTALDDTRASRIALLSTDALDGGTVQWSPVTSTAAVSNGRLVWREQAAVSSARRYYRTVETP